MSDGKPSLLAYLSTAKPTIGKPVERVTTMVLSTNAGAEARERTKEKEKAAAAGKALELHAVQVVSRTCSNNSHSAAALDSPQE